MNHMKDMNYIIHMRHLRIQVKALLRRATARDALQKYEEAEKDLRQVGGWETRSARKM